MSLNAIVSHNNKYNNCICVLHAALTIIIIYGICVDFI